jgi:hypothetical protein
LAQYIFSRDMEHHYDNVLEILNLPALHNRRRRFDEFILTIVFIETKCYPPCPRNSRLRVPSWNIRNSATLTYSSATVLRRDVSTVNAVCKLNRCFWEGLLDCYMPKLIHLAFILSFLVCFALCCQFAAVCFHS